VCSPEGFQNEFVAEASASVDVFGVIIDVTKEADPLIAKVGDTVDYEITLINDSSADTPALNCVATDSLLGEVFNGVLPLAGEVINVSRDVAAGDDDPLVNTVTLVCSPEGFENQVEDSASADVDLINPAIEISKICEPDPVDVGDLITWTITLDNTGDVDLDCVLNDDTAGITDQAVPVAAQSSEVVEVSREVLSEDAPQLSNTATVVCTLAAPLDDLPNTVSDEATDTCEVNDEFVTRTLGYWKNHPTVIDGSFDGPDGFSSLLPQEFCGETVDQVCDAVELLSSRGGGINNFKRQAMAALLNCEAFGCPSNISDLIAEGSAACAGVPNGFDFGAAGATLDEYNNSGDDLDLPFQSPRALPKFCN